MSAVEYWAADKPDTRVEEALKPYLKALEVNNELLRSFLNDPVTPKSQKSTMEFLIAHNEYLLKKAEVTP